jgi:cytidine deaminase
MKGIISFDPPWVNESPRLTEHQVWCFENRLVDRQEHVGGFAQMLEFLVDQAKSAAENDAFNYRNFRVGCAVYAHTPGTRRREVRTRVFSAGNRKQSEKDVKNCAERRAILRAQEAGFTQIEGLVIVAKAQADDASKIITPTLHSCLACRNFLSSTPGVFPDTLVVTVNKAEGFRECMTVKQMLELHRPL